ncbi:hypothetical protein ACX80N_03250 [Arthrobacter sp. MDT2-16]|uniref:hypothetical protein n=1 Tax=Arthrobacter ruber TaxID=1258893 RepID=UPI000CF42F50|nr:hypothetical protein [Arthrobacter ruber]
MTQQTQQRSAWRAAHAAGLTASDLWLHYYSVGGALEPLELDAYLHGMYLLPQSERNRVAVALNELIDDLPPRPRADFVDDVSPTTVSDHPQPPPASSE